MYVIKWHKLLKLGIIFKHLFLVRFQVLTAACMMFRVVFWDILPCKMIVDRRFRVAYCLHMKRRSTIILHGNISQKTTLNIYSLSQRKQPITIKTIIYSILFRAIIAVYSEIHTKQINRSTLCGQDAELVIVEAGGTYRYH
jgi:hypothetical protein